MLGRLLASIVYCSFWNSLNRGRVGTEHKSCVLMSPILHSLPLSLKVARELRVHIAPVALIVSHFGREQRSCVLTLHVLHSLSLILEESTNVAC